MKLALLRIANATLRPLGVQIYHEGIDMESVLRRLAPRAGDIGTVIDIGASTGRWSALAMPYFPHARFVGVDPLAEREPDLKRLKARAPRFDYVLCAAGATDGGTVPMAVGADLDGSTVGGSDGAVRQVPLHSIDGIVRMKGCPGPYLLKFDTHGFEVPILDGAAETLKTTRYIVMEVYNYRHVPGTLLFWEMCAKLEGLGFRCFNLADPMQRPLDRALWQMDLFFARKGDPVFAHDSYRLAQ
jgi:FkbM family methyltransferase